MAHHVSKDGVKPSYKNVDSIVKYAVPKTYTDIRSFTGAVGHYRRFIKNFAKIAVPLYNLVSGVNKDKKSESVMLTPEALEAFEILKKKCVQAPILTFPDFNKTFLLETDASGKGLGAVLSQKQEDGRYHPVAYASRTLTEAEQRYHSNKQEFLALKWAIMEQFHEYLSPYGKNQNEFVVRTDNNPLTYAFSSARLDAVGHRWVNALAGYNFSLEYQRGKDNTVADFLSRVKNRLSEAEVEEYVTKIPQPGVQAVLDNAITPITEKAESGVDLPPAQAKWADMLSARPVQLGTLHVLDWQKAQKEDKTLYTLVKNLRSPREVFREAMCKVLDNKAVQAYEKKRNGLVIKNGLLYHKTRMSKTGEDLWRFVVPQAHRSAALEGCHRDAGHQGQRRSLSLLYERFWWPGMTKDLVNKVKNCGRCKKYNGAPPIAKLQKLPCAGPGELVHINFTSIEETVGLNEQPTIWDVLVIQDHFSKHVVAYVVKDQTARTVAKTLRWGYFGLFGAPAYLLSDKGPAFTSRVVEDLCKMYGVQKLRTSSYHAQTNGQVERMNQTLIRMIGKLEDDKKACWSLYLPEVLMAYNSTRSAVTGYSPHFLLFGRRPRIPVDFQFPTLLDMPHKTKLERSVAEARTRLKEAFAIARQLTSEEAARQERYYDVRLVLLPYNLGTLLWSALIGLQASGRSRIVGRQEAM